MSAKQLVKGMGRGLTMGLGVAAGAYAAYAGSAWLRYGHTEPAAPWDDDPLLDSFMPVYEIVERHRVFVSAPAETTFASALDVDFEHSSVINAIFKTRAMLLGSEPDTAARPKGLMPLVTSLGWGVLAEKPNREIVFGAVTRPWDANVVFRAIPPEAFASFNEPNYVKIAWTLRADPVGRYASLARSETRAIATDAAARARFRRYWSAFSPGIVLIRIAALRLVKHDAEHRIATEGHPHADRFNLVSTGDLDAEC